jgi:hypothetical protein
VGYRGNSQYDERDKLFQGVGGKNSDPTQVKKQLDALFTPKAKAPTPENCQGGHAWIRDWDGVTKCTRCKAPRPKG